MSLAFGTTTFGLGAVDAYGFRPRHELRVDISGISLSLSASCSTGGKQCAPQQLRKHPANKKSPRSRMSFKEHR